ncbi:MAG TPA: hypothetical protein P5241_01615 [Candidatus Paceibacterota bacterium]|nr:hypothetical protein [Candidatus Paceibacterota bacterium]
MLPRFFSVKFIVVSLPTVNVFGEKSDKVKSAPIVPPTLQTDAHS